MGKLRKTVELTGMFQSKRIDALFDSGSYSNYIRSELSDGTKIEDIGYHARRGGSYSIVANGTLCMSDSVVFNLLKVNEHKIHDPIFIIMDGLPEDAIIGVKLMQELGIILDLSSEEVVLK